MFLLIFWHHVTVIQQLSMVHTSNLLTKTKWKGSDHCIIINGLEKVIKGKR